ncbi:MAG TPA: hypothetical protein PKD53_20735 [Chloroflexaceae bacterium]|nr:hypothetical protein [Chloroflexaceae bacterium]
MTQDPSRRGQGSTTTGSGQSMTGASTSQDMSDKAREAARQAQEKVGDIAGQATHQASSQLANQKDRVADSLGGVAQRLRQTGQQMHDQDDMGLTNYVDRAASQVESFSNYLRRNDIGSLVDDVERFARREPAIFFGSAFLLGLLGARFMKSSRPRPSYDERYYGSSSAYEPYARPYYTGYAEPGYGSGTEYGRPGTTTGSDYMRGVGTTSGTNMGESAGYTGSTRPQSPARSDENTSGPSSQRGAGIYDKNREGS